MSFAPKSKHVDEMNVCEKYKTQRFNVFLSLNSLIDAQMSWKCHIEYTYKTI